MKKSEKEHQHSSITTLSIIPGTIVLFCCVLILFFIAVIAMYRAGMIELPDFMERILSAGDADEGEDRFSEDFLASVQGSAPDLTHGNEEFRTLSFDSLKDLLLQSVPAESVYLVMDAVWMDPHSGFREKQIYYIRSGDKVHAEIYIIGEEPKHVISSAEQFFIREGNDSRVFPRKGEYAAFTPENEVGIPTLQHVQDMIRQAEEGSYVLKMEAVSNSPCIRASFTDPLTGTEEIYDVMPDLGLVLAASAVFPKTGQQHYRMTVYSVLTDLTGLDKSLFDIPNS